MSGATYEMLHISASLKMFAINLLKNTSLLHHVKYTSRKSIFVHLSYVFEHKIQFVFAEIQYIFIALEEMT